MARRVRPNDWEDDVAQPPSKQPTLFNTPTGTAIRQLSSSVADHLNCAICLQFFDVPKNMPQCGHVFCLGCLQRLHKPPSTLITCPQCRQVNALGKNGVEGLHTNVAISGAVEALKAHQHQRKEEEAKATSAEDVACWHGGENFVCPHCNRLFCKICSIVHMEKLKIEALKSAENFLGNSDKLSDPQMPQFLATASEKAFISADAALDKIGNELRSTFEQTLSNQIASIRKELCQLRDISSSELLEQRAKCIAEIEVMKDMSKRIQTKSVLDTELQQIASVHSGIIIREKNVNLLLTLTKPDHLPIFKFETSENLQKNFAHCLSGVKIGAILNEYCSVSVEKLSSFSEDCSETGSTESLSSPGPQQQPHIDNKLKLPTTGVRHFGTSQPVAVRSNGQFNQTTPPPAATPWPLPPTENASEPFSAATSGAASSNQLIGNSVNQGVNQAEAKAIAPNKYILSCLAPWIQPNRKLFVAVHHTNKIMLIDPHGNVVGTFQIVENKPVDAQPMENLQIDCIIGCRDRDVLYYTCSYRPHRNSILRALCSVDLSDGDFNAQRRFKIESGPDYTPRAPGYHGVAFSDTWQVLFSSENGKSLLISQPNWSQKFEGIAPVDGRLHVLALLQVDETNAWLFCSVSGVVFRVDITRLDAGKLRFGAIVKPHPYCSEPIFPGLKWVASYRFCLVDKTLFTSDGRTMTVYDVGSSNKEMFCFSLPSRTLNKGVAVLPITGVDGQNYIGAENAESEIVLFPITCNR